MTPARRALSASVIASCAIALAACGGGGGDSAAAAAVSQGFLKNAGLKLTSSQAACMGTGVINDFGVAQSINYGFLGKNNAVVNIVSPVMSAKDAATFTDTYMGCADPVSLIRDALIAKVAPQSSTTQTQLVACLNKNLTRSVVRAALIAAFSGDQNNTALNPVFAACSQAG